MTSTLFHCKAHELGARTTCHHTRVHALAFNSMGKEQEAEEKAKKGPLFTIYEKMQVVDFASSLIATNKPKIAAALRKRKRNAGGERKRKVRRRFSCRGLNLQKLCEQKFPSLRGIKVCTLLAQCEKQKWRSLSIEQQKKYFQVPDSLKVALGQHDKVRGWKQLGRDKLMENIQEKGFVNRWNVPGPVLQEMCAVSIVTPNSWVVQMLFNGCKRICYRRLLLQLLDLYTQIYIYI